MEKYWTLYTWPIKLKNTLESAKKNTQGTEKKFMDLLKKSKLEIKKAIDKLKIKFTEIK